MTIAQHLQLICNALETWAKGYGGRASIARDPVHIFDLLRMKPGGIDAVVMFREEKKPDPNPCAGMAQRTFLVILSRGRGFTLEQGDSLVKGAAGGPALYDLIEEARALVWALVVTPSTEAHEPGQDEMLFNYAGCRLFEFAGATLVDAYQLEFTIWTQI
jgi:hypothetical protein